MNWFKRNPVLGSVLLVLAALLAAEGWFWSRSRQQAVRALAALEQKKQDRDWLARQSPALSDENARAIEHDLANTGQVLAALRTALQGRDARGLAAPVPAKSIDVFFDLAAFVEKTRVLAAQSKVAIRPDERFGFASHANEGPEAELVPAVFRQRLLAQYLLDALLEAHPRSLVSLQREHPLTAAQRAARNQPPVPGAPVAAAATTSGQAADFFDFDPQLSVRVPGRVDSDAFRLEFTGQTPALRAFLNTLAGFKLSCVVRSVEVQPAADEATPQGEAADTPAVTGAPVPIVTQNLSKFAVVVEFVVLVPASEKSAP